MDPFPRRPSSRAQQDARRGGGVAIGENTEGLLVAPPRTSVFPRVAVAAPPSKRPRISHARAAALATPALESRAFELRLEEGPHHQPRHPLQSRVDELGRGADGRSNQRRGAAGHPASRDAGKARWRDAGHASLEPTSDLRGLARALSTPTLALSGLQISAFWLVLLSDPCFVDLLVALPLYAPEHPARTPQKALQDGWRRRYTQV